ncbi:hypothetical protein RCH14_004482 [Massilia sp. MP_M2]|uniref:hypothetical protein n=1 Tax=Massilia sp. MP_M2 TaxID=3071713 RepID=UPI00319E400F
MAKLHGIKLSKVNENGNKFCGPSAISVIAGIGTKEASALIRSRTNSKSPVKGTYTHQVRFALEKLGYHMADAALTARVVLQDWAQEAARERVYLVAAANHWIVVEGDRAICGKTRDFVRLEDHPNARSPVDMAFEVKQIAVIDPESVIPKRPLPTKEERAEGACRREAKLLADQFAIDVSQDNKDDSIWVNPPGELFEGREHDDPYDDIHYCDTWSEALDRVCEYVELIEAAHNAIGQQIARTSPHEAENTGL